jgi:hypothetical protein
MIQENTFRNIPFRAPVCSVEPIGYFRSGAVYSQGLYVRS